MKTKLLIFAGFFIATLLCASANEAVFWVGTSKSKLVRQTLEFPRSIWNAMSLFVGPFGKTSRMILVRDGKCFVINGSKDLDAVRDLPVLPGDRIQKYVETDLKEWKLPVLEGADAVALLVKAEKGRALETRGAP
jgi:hypothetical protein